MPTYMLIVVDDPDREWTPEENGQMMASPNSQEYVRSTNTRADSISGPVAAPRAMRKMRSSK